MSSLPGCLWVNGALFEAENSRGNPISEGLCLECWSFRSQFVRDVIFDVVVNPHVLLNSNWVYFTDDGRREWYCSGNDRLGAGWNFKIVRFLLFESIQSEAFMIFLESQRNVLGHPQNKYRGHPEVRTANPATLGNKGVGIIWVFRNSLLLQHMSRDIMISCKNSMKNVTSLYCILLHVIPPIHTCRHVVLCRYSVFFLRTKNHLHFPSRKLDLKRSFQRPGDCWLSWPTSFRTSVAQWGTEENLIWSEKWEVPWKINMEHNHRGLEDYFPLEMGDLHVPC